MFSKKSSSGLQNKANDGMVETFINRRIIKLLTKLQQQNSDPIGIGEKFRIKYPKLWEQINWHDIFPTARFRVRTEFTIQRTELFR